MQPAWAQAAVQPQCWTAEKLPTRKVSKARSHSQYYCKEIPPKVSQDVVRHPGLEQDFAQVLF